MAKPQVSFAKRQREQAKREKQMAKAARKAERKTEDRPDGFDDMIEGEVVAETPLELEDNKG